MAIKLTKTERAKIDTEREWIERIAMADVIATQHRRSGAKSPIWKRPIAEIKARGLPAKLIVLTFEVSTNAEVNEFRERVGRMKGPGTTQAYDGQIPEDVQLLEMTWINPGDIKVGGPLKHDSLSPLSLAHARRLYNRVGYLIQPTFEKWEVGFLQERDPIGELLAMEKIARAVEKYMAAHPDADKTSVFGDTCKASFGDSFTAVTPQELECKELLISEAAEMKAAAAAMAPMTNEKLAAYLGIELGEDDNPSHTAR